MPAPRYRTGVPAPDDFGLTPAQTLAHVGETSPSPGHGPFWNRWGAEVWGKEPDLAPIGPAGDAALQTAAAMGVTHLVESIGAVRIGCRLVEPRAGAIAGAVITTHGYGERSPMTDDSAWSGRQIAVLKVRARGFPGSQMDTGDLTAQEGGWITTGLDQPDTWVLRGAVADVVQAHRALRRRYGGATPIAFHGESFGGGLALLAAAQFAGREKLFRIAIGLPTFGDWRWRLARRTGQATGIGAGDEVQRFVAQRPEQADQIVDTVRMLDTVVHAARVYCPVLCKLAVRDEVVPAPAAAAVYNALGSSPGRKWRFVTRYGHFDGGAADLRRHALAERLAGEFLDPANELAELMRRRSAELHGEA